MLGRLRHARCTSSNRTYWCAGERKSARGEVLSPGALFYNDRVILTRRSFLAVAAGAAGASAAVHVPGLAAALPHPKGGFFGLELYSLRNELKKDLAG